MRVDPKRNRVPFWQLALYAVAAAAGGATHPIRKMWRSENAIDRYALCHLTSAAGDSIATIVERRELRQVSDAGELGAVVDRVIEENSDAAEKFRAGNESVIGFLVGQVMKASGGSANPTLAQELLRERLSG